jgi:hypothetical protein
LKHCFVEGEIRYELLKFSILFLQKLETPQLSNSGSCVLSLPSVERHLCHASLTTYIGDADTTLGFL